MRTRISTNITWPRYIFGAITIVLLYNIFQLLVANGDITMRVQIELIMAFTTALSFYYFSQRKKLEYDDEYLYRIWKKKETKIPLSNIKKVRLTHIKINNKDTWKIDYKDHEGRRDNIRFIPNKQKPHYFEAFKKHVKEVNKDVKIEDIAKSL